MVFTHPGSHLANRFGSEINPIRYCWGPFGPTPTLKANISMMAEGKKKLKSCTPSKMYLKSF